MAKRILTTLCLILASLPAAKSGAQSEENAIGPVGHVGALDGAKTVDELRITQPGVYENIIVDRNWKTSNAVRITADDVVLKNCTVIHVGRGNAIGVFGDRCRIENCKIRYCLSGTAAGQVDSHGIAGKWSDILIVNCDIGQVSGDCVQFDPGRSSKGRVEISNCRLWNAPLPQAMAGFRKGQRPGEDAVDTKTVPPTKNPKRDQIIIRNTLIQGWQQPAVYTNISGVNLKEHVEATIENCVFDDCHIAMRLRGGSGTSRGGAVVKIDGVAVYNTTTAVRTEQNANVSINNLQVGKGVKTLFYQSLRRARNVRVANLTEAPPIHDVIAQGVVTKSP